MFEECFGGFRSSPFGEAKLKEKKSPQVNLEGGEGPFCYPGSFDLSWFFVISESWGC